MTPTGEGCSAKSAFDPTRQDVRSKLPFPPKNLMPGKPFPRVHVKDLYEPKNEDYLYRRKPFILTNAADDWTAVKGQIFEIGATTSKVVSRSVVDFYPMNMLETGSHPYLFRLKQGLAELELPPAKAVLERQSLKTPGATGQVFAFSADLKDMEKLRESGALGKKCTSGFERMVGCQNA